MSFETQTALQRVAACSPGHNDWFVRRLCRDHGWNRNYAQRVVSEYERFTVLAATYGNVTPSTAVDWVWHLHILDTEAYANFCQQALGVPFLHHRPGQDCAEERERLNRSYHRTLALYQADFGEPTADVWPAARGCVAKLPLTAAQLPWLQRASIPRQSIRLFTALLVLLVCWPGLVLADGQSATHLGTRLAEWFYLTFLIISGLLGIGRLFWWFVILDKDRRREYKRAAAEEKARSANDEQPNVDCCSG